MIVGGGPLLLKNRGGIPQDFIHYYSFDDADVSGSTLTDLGSASIDGTINAGITTGQAGQINEAFLFDGSNDGNISVSGHTFWTSEFTYHQLVYYDTASDRGSIYTSGESFGAATQRDFDFFVRGNNTGIGTVFTDGSNNLIVLTGSDPLPEQEWVMVTVKWAGTSAETVELKINNTVTASGNLSSTPSTIFDPRIGGRSATLSYEWQGLQDELIIYDRFTSNEEDAAIFAAWGL